MKKEAFKVKTKQFLGVSDLQNRIEQIAKKQNVVYRDFAEAILKVVDHNSMIPCTMNDQKMVLPAGILAMYPHCLHYCGQ